MNNQRKGEKMKAKMTAWYLYADGHAVLNFEQDHPQAGRVEWVEILEKLNPKLQCRFEGRLVFHRYGGGGFFNLLKRSAYISASKATTEAGSENSRKMGLAVGHLEIGSGSYEMDSLYWTSTPDVISSPWTYQPDVQEAFDPNAATWGLSRVAKVRRQPVKLEVQAGQPTESEAA